MILFFCLMFSSRFLAAQMPEADSLKRHLSLLEKQYSPTDTVVIKCLNDIGYSMRNNVHDSALVYAQEAFRRSSMVNFLRGKADALLTKGIVAIYEGHYNASLDYHIQAQTLYSSLRDTAQQGFILNNIGYLYKVQGNISRAKEYFTKSEDLFRAINHTSGLSLVWGNFSDLALKSGQFDEALRLEYQALNAARQSKSGIQNYAVGVSLYHIGTIFYAKKFYDSALHYQRQALDLFLADGNNTYIIRSLDNVAAIHGAQGNMRAAFAEARRAEYFAKNFNVPLERLLIEERLGKLFEQERNFEQALRYFQRTQFLRDSLNALNIEQRIKILDMMREAEQSEKEVVRVKSEQQELQWVRNSLIAGITFVLLLLALSVNRYRYKSRAERTLRNSNDLILQQQEELISSNVSLEQANKRLETLNTEKDELLSIVAHDLKNPLTGIVLASSQLQRDVELRQNISIDRINTVTSRISASSERMMNIITKLLRSNVLENAVQLQSQIFDITALVKEIVEEHHSHAESKSIALHLDLPPKPIFITADPDACAEIIENLLDNALKYSPKGKNIFVRMKGSQSPFVIGNLASDKVLETSSEAAHTPHDQWQMTNKQMTNDQMTNYQAPKTHYIRLEVADEGPGLTDKDKQQLFRKFTRLSAQPTSGEQSTGLGLNIVKKLVDAMKGRVWCESEQDKGATFIVEFNVQ